MTDRQRDALVELRRSGALAELINPQLNQFRAVLEDTGTSWDETNIVRGGCRALRSLEARVVSVCEQRKKSVDTQSETE